MSEDKLDKLLRTQIQMIAQQSQMLGGMNSIRESVAELLLRIHVLEAHVESKEKSRT